MPVISTNTAANTALISLNKNSDRLGKSLNRLSSGSKIVRASDDAAGLAISTSLQSDHTTLRQAAINAVQGRSILQTVDGILARVDDLLNRALSIATQSNSGSVTNTERSFLDAEYQQLMTEISDLQVAAFNGIYLVDNSFNYNFQVGLNASDVINVNLTSIWIGGLATSGSNVATLATTLNSIADIKSDFLTIPANRALVGAYLSRFEQRSDVIDSSIENLAAARSVITDIDIAAEQSNLVSSQVLTEAAVAALSQANKMKTSLLSLLE